MFDTLKSVFRILGLFQKNKLRFINNFIVCSFYGFIFITTLFFILLEAKTISEYTEASFFSSCGILYIMSYLTFVRKNNDYIQLMDEMESLINESIKINFMTCYT